MLGAFHPQAWFIFSFVIRGRTSGGFIISSIIYCYLEIFWRPKVSDVSTTPLRENQLASQTNSFPLLSNNIRIVSNQ